MSSSVVYPVDYPNIAKQIMERDILEDYGYPVSQSSDEEFDLSRGYTAEVYGWKMFCDEIGPFEDNPCYGSKIVGNLYDAENGLGYIGYITEIDGKPYPIIHNWAERTRIRFPGKGRYEIDKHDAIYYYESLDIC